MPCVSNVKSHSIEIKYILKKYNHVVTKQITKQKKRNKREKNKPYSSKECSVVLLFADPCLRYTLTQMLYCLQFQQQILIGCPSDDILTYTFPSIVQTL